MTNSVVYAGRNPAVTTCILENKNQSKLFIRTLPEFRGLVVVGDDQRTVTFDCQDTTSLESLIVALEDCLDARRLDDLAARRKSP